MPSAVAVARLAGGDAPGALLFAAGLVIGIVHGRGAGCGPLPCPGVSRGRRRGAFRPRLLWRSGSIRRGRLVAPCLLPRSAPRPLVPGAPPAAADRVCSILLPLLVLAPGGRPSSSLPPTSSPALTVSDLPSQHRAKQIHSRAKTSKGGENKENALEIT